MVLNNIIQETDQIYKKLTSKDNDPEVESSLKSELLSKLSSLMAIAKVKQGSISEDLKNKLNSVKDLLLSWDPLDNWFKEVKELVEGVFDLIVAAKAIEYDEFIVKPTYVSSEEYHKFASGIISDIENVKKELIDLKLKVAAVDKKAKSMPKSKSAPTAVPKPVPVEIPRPVPVEIPKPVPVEIPAPVPVEVPKLKTKPKAPSKPRAAKKPAKRQQKKEKLFGLFSQPSASEQKPIPIEVAKPVPVEVPKPAARGFKSIGPMKTVSKPSNPSAPPSPFKSVGASPTISVKPSAGPKDQDKLYQELITLEGKKYSLERKLRDLKAIFDSGAMTENQYKSSSTERLAELKGISSQIDKIREQLD